MVAIVIAKSMLGGLLRIKPTQPVANTTHFTTDVPSVMTPAAATAPTSTILSFFQNLKTAAIESVPTLVVGGLALWGLSVEIKSILPKNATAR